MNIITEKEISDMADKIIKVISNNTKDNIKESIVNGINYLVNKAALQNENILSMPDLASEWFAEQRKKSGLTLRQVEEGTGISNPYLSQLENGKIKNPSFLVVQKLNNFYNASVVKKDTDDNISLEKLIEEFPEYGIDTSKWEYEYVDSDAIDFLNWFFENNYRYIGGSFYSNDEAFKSIFDAKPSSLGGLYQQFRESQPQQKEESEKELEERTERNMNVISAFCEHLESENIVIPESVVLSFFNA